MRTTTSADTPIWGDTAVGTIAVVGAEPFAHVVLRPANSGSIALTGPHTATLRRLGGMEVWVSGTPGPTLPRPRPGFSIDVRDFRVRSVNGEQVVDGRLVADGDALVLVAHDGRRHQLLGAPDALRAHVGRRVWVGRPIDRRITTFGVVDATGDT